MTTEQENNSNNAQATDEFKLPEKMDISCVAELLSRLKELTTADNDLILNGNDVDKLTTPALQLLISAANTLSTKNKRIILKDPSEEMQSVFLDLGLENKLKEWS